jgi:hypothetical protein
MLELRNDNIKTIRIKRTSDSMSLIRNALSNDEWEVIGMIKKIIDAPVSMNAISSMDLSYLLDLPKERIETIMEGLRNYSIKFTSGSAGSMDKRLVCFDAIHNTRDEKTLVRYLIYEKITLTTEEMRDELYKFGKEVNGLEGE